MSLPGIWNAFPATSNDVHMIVEKTGACDGSSSSSSVSVSVKVLMIVAVVMLLI